MTDSTSGAGPEFHLTGFVKGTPPPGMGDSLTDKVFAQMQALLNQFTKAGKGGVAMLQKLSGVAKQVDNLGSLLNQLGNHVMNSSQLTQWKDDFNSGIAKATQAIKGLGDPQYQSQLMSALKQVADLVQKNQFVKDIQQTVKNLKALYKAMKAMNHAYPTQGQVQAFMVALNKLQGSGKELESLGRGLEKVPGMGGVGKSVLDFGQHVGRVTKGILNWAPPLGGPATSVASEYELWKKRGKEAKGHIVTYFGAGSSGAGEGLWSQFHGRVSRAIDEGKGIEKKGISEKEYIGIINQLAMGKISTADLGSVWNAYQTAIQGSNTLLSTVTSLSSQSVASAQSLQAGGETVIKMFTAAMGQPIQVVNLSISNIQQNQ